MQHFIYPARFTPDKDGGFVVTFPDVPEAITQGDEVRRLLDPRHASKLSRLEAALAALGQQLVVGVKAAA